MPVSKIISSAIFALVLGGGAAFAQAFNGANLPAEFPPTSYKGKQYVDSKGCVFIRAGVDGNVTWVPRVTRARQPICGAQPTFAKAAPKAEAPAPKVAQAPAPKPAPKPAPVQKPVVVAAKPAPVVKTARTAPIRTVASVTTPPRVLAAPPAPKRAAPVQLAAPAASGCTGLGASGRYMQGAGLRCGPQVEPPVSYGSGAGRVAAAPVVRQGTVAPGTRVVPKHVAQLQANATTGVRVPDGYRPVWKDDRLNPRRAQQTFSGKAQMDLVWTQTVPRRLIDRRTGQDVTRFYPNVTYPYTDLATQQRDKAFKYAKTGKISTKGQVQPVQAAKTAGKSYVQVGTFGVPANAQRSAARLQQAGLPVRMAQYSKGGKSYQIVMAGPFASPQQVNAALSTARRAGFRDAFAR
ncbi:Sporulation related domain-containing protein [Thalassovita litoralis]|jgi:cell division protein FtsN|uniref:Sporulation related domain-containing protein n=1 Tax=Thalassovita litoralis TaxID=1010611 RepID=A0A521FEU0_9RHOB|nr:SPOR domain-containing protein [Thalassovita litoralis]SMO94702.1 Sporulation related domain-containing protein [Thalassovita litoralis]